MRLGFVAVHGLDRLEVLDRFGEAESDASTLYAPAVGVSPEGWVIILKPDPDFPRPEQLASASRGGRAVAYWADTVVMYSAASEYRDGLEVWWVEHDGYEANVHDLTSRGEPPAGFEAIVAAARKKQAESEHRDSVDYLFDVPENVVYAICEYHPERETTIEFKALERRSPPKKPGFLARLFGAT